jgi:CheY-like chemotaxis protein
VTVLEGLMGARGATGPLVDLSLEGLRMRVDRAMTLQGKAPLDVGAGTFPQGTRFPILRIDQLPYTPVVVCAGVVAHVAIGGGDVLMGIRFEGLGEMEAQSIRQVLGRRLPKFNQGFPERRSPRKAGEERTGSTVLVHRGSSGEALPVQPPEDSRKALRRLLVALEDDLDRAVLVTALREDGYRKLHEARSYAEALDHVRVFPMDAVILGDSLAGLSAEDFLKRLRMAGFCEDAPSVLLAEHLDARTTARARDGQFDHVQGPVEEPGEGLRDVLEHLLNLQAR